MKRYVKEFANDIIKSTKSDEFMIEDCKNRRIDRINKIVGAAERGLITVREAMKMIAES